MRAALEVVAAKKPLVVVMGPVAGSGGYLVAAPGRWIIARSATLTGSIGVLTGKLVTGGLWSKLLVNRETIALGRHSTMESDERPYSAEERQIVHSLIDRSYAWFLDVVAAARKLDRPELEPIAGGRVWTGRQALERKLIDELGGLDAGVAKARSLANLPQSVPAREVHPPKRSVPPRTIPATAALAGYLFDGARMFNRTPVWALMDLVTED
jgi:protease-4